MALRHTNRMSAIPRFAGLIVLLFTLGAVPAAARPGTERLVCHKLQRDMDRLRATMRQGYSARQGERYRSRMQRLKSRYYRRCRPVDR